MLSTDTALDTALAYHRAWTSHDFESAMTYIADDIECDAPAGHLVGAEAFRGFMEPFAGSVTVQGVKITHMRIVFDRAPFIAARQKAA